MVSGVASGWASLCEELESNLRQLDPPGELTGAEVDADGVLRFRARLDAQARDEGRKLVRECESRALEVCELCGGTGRVHAGAIVTVRCEDCAGAIVTVRCEDCAAGERI